MVALNRTADLAAKLSPDAVRVSGQFHAILGCMLGETWTRPRLEEIMITSDGWLMGRAEGDCGFNHILGTADDLDRNLRGVAKTVGLTAAETRHLLSLAPKRGRC